MSLPEVKFELTVEGEKNPDEEQRQSGQLDPYRTDEPKYPFAFEGEKTFSVDRAEIDESLNAPYTAQVVLTAPIAERCFHLGMTCLLSWARPSDHQRTLAYMDPENVRRLWGIVTQIERTVVHQDRVQVSLTIRPALTALQHTYNARTFVGMKTPEILTALLRDGLASYGRSFSLEDVAKEQPVRDFTVQYNESDFAVMQRLCYEDGISYTFDHSGAREKIVFFEQTAKLTKIQKQQDIEFVYDGATREGIVDFRDVRREGSTAVQFIDHDWTQPGDPLNLSLRRTTQDNRQRMIRKHLDAGFASESSPVSCGIEAYKETVQPPGSPPHSLLRDGAETLGSLIRPKGPVGEATAAWGGTAAIKTAEHMRLSDKWGKGVAFYAPKWKRRNYWKLLELTARAAKQKHGTQVQPRDRGLWGRKRAVVALQREELRLSAGSRGQSQITGLSPGCLFHLVGHPYLNGNQTYLVLGVKHVGVSEGTKASGKGTRERSSYVSYFTCVPDIGFCRPTEVPPPATNPGLQVATVVAPQGHPLYTDDFGRVQIIFSWDSRSTPSENDPNSNAVWARVLQGSAGGSFGNLTIPRAGMEVLVAFSDGEAARPVVLGCAYNGRNRPPAELPDESLKTVLRSRSNPDPRDAPGGAAALLPSPGNEISFDDTSPWEEFRVKAQRTLDVKVGSRLHFELGGVLPLFLKKLAIKKLKLPLPKAKPSVMRRDLGATPMVTDEAVVDINGDVYTDIAGKGHTTFGEAKIKTEGLYRLRVGKNLCVKVRGVSKRLIEGKEEEVVKGSKQVQVDGALTTSTSLLEHIVKKWLATVEDAITFVTKKMWLVKAEKAALKAEKIIELTQGGAKILIKNGEVHITGKKLVFNGKQVNLKSGGTVTVKGSKVAIN